MLYRCRKFIAVLMLLWLPIASGSAMASSMSMQLRHGGCNENVTSAHLQHDAMAGHHMHHSATPVTSGEHSQPCNDCGVCHLACTGYLAVPTLALIAAPATTQESTPYLFAFNSFTAAPLVPPPLARA
jgi:hypothetical protein